MMWCSDMANGDFGCCYGKCLKSGPTAHSEHLRPEAAVRFALGAARRLIRNTSARGLRCDSPWERPGGSCPNPLAGSVKPEALQRLDARLVAYRQTMAWQRSCDQGV